jgi:hypothetical protein
VSAGVCYSSRSPTLWFGLVIPYADLSLPINPEGEIVPEWCGTFMPEQVGRLHPESQGFARL